MGRRSKLEIALDDIVATSESLVPEFRKRYFAALHHTGENFLAKQEKFNERVNERVEKESEYDSIVRYLRKELGKDQYDKNFIKLDTLQQLVVDNVADIPRGTIFKIVNANVHEIGINPLSDNHNARCFYKDEFKNLVLKYANGLLKKKGFFVYSDIYDKLGLSTDARAPLSTVLKKLADAGKFKIEEPRLSQPGARVYARNKY